MSTTELEAKLQELKKDLFMLRMQHATNQLDNPIKIQTVKKDIARVKTILREKENRPEA
jgi:large subunit ribosomal protein L29